MAEAGVASGPKISIVIATLDAGKTLKACLDSIIEQTYADKEIILMDGGSTDDTLEIVRECKQDIAYWESSKDTGIYHAWNKALPHVSGDWVMFLGADDYFFSATALEVMAGHLASSSDALLVYGCALLGGRDSTVKRGGAWDWGIFRRRMSIPHTAAFHNSRMFRVQARFDESYRIAGDYEYMLRWGSSLLPIFVNEIVVCMGRGGISKTLKHMAVDEWRKAQIKNKSAPVWKIFAWHWMYKWQLWASEIRLERDSAG